MTPGNSLRNSPDDFDFPSMRPPDRVVYNRLSPVDRLISNIFLYVPLLAAAGLVVAVRHDAPAWLLAPALLLGAGGWVLTRWYWKRKWAAQNLPDGARR
jgi:hypothetical protein